MTPSKTNGLAVLAFKCAARVFDISSGLAQVSIRDQIVRAQLFIDDLCAKDQTKGMKLLVVGSGIAGVSAALRAKHLGLDVVLVDVRGKPFSLQDGVNTRFVGPFMYEWPIHGFCDQSYPKSQYGNPSGSMPSWSSEGPMPASELVQQLNDWLQKRPPDDLPDTYLGVDQTKLQDYVRKFVASAKTKSASVPKLKLSAGAVDLVGKIKPSGRDFKPRYVVLAVGMGQEKTSMPGHSELSGAAFWTNDSFRLRSAFNGTAGVFGGGDGALQDVLRLLTRHDHPLQLMDAVERSSHSVRATLLAHQASVLALEQQARLLSMWAPSDAYVFLDNECQAVCEKLAKVRTVRSAVLRQLRRGVGCVHHVWKEQTFGKAYLLNRFVLHLIEQCLKASGKTERFLQRNRVRYEPHRGGGVVSSSKVSGKRAKVKMQLETSGPWIELTHIAVRYGVQSPDREERMVTLSDKRATDRMSMSGILLPPQLPVVTI